MKSYSYVANNHTLQWTSNGVRRGWSMGFLAGIDRGQISLLPPCVDDYVAPDALVRVVDAFVAGLNFGELGFDRTVAAATGRPGYDPGDMLRLYIWGYLNQVRSSRLLERACVRDSSPAA